MRPSLSSFDDSESSRDYVTNADTHDVCKVRIERARKHAWWYETCEMVPRKLSTIRRPIVCA